MPLDTTQSLAIFLGLKPPRVYDMARKGLIPVVRMGRRVMFDREAIVEWMRAGGRGLPGGWRREAKDGVD